jgi:hypothetical protein
VHNHFRARYDIILDLKIALRSAALETWRIAWCWLNIIFGYDSDLRVGVAGVVAGEKNVLDKRRQLSKARAIEWWSYLSSTNGLTGYEGVSYILNLVHSTSLHDTGSLAKN